MPDSLYCKKKYFLDGHFCPAVPQPYQVEFIPDVFSVLDKYGLRQYFIYSTPNVSLPNINGKNVVRATVNRSLSQKLDFDVNFSRFRNMHNTCARASI